MILVKIKKRDFFSFQDVDVTDSKSVDADLVLLKVVNVRLNWLRFDVNWSIRRSQDRPLGLIFLYWQPNIFFGFPMALFLIKVIPC